MVFGLWGKKKPRFIDEPDEIYSSRRLADAALVRAVREAQTPVVVASFFAASRARLETALSAAGVDVRPAGDSNPPAPGSAAWLLDAGRVRSNLALDAWLTRAGRAFTFLFVEHYPLLRTETSVLDWIDELSSPHRHRVRFFAGLDEPLMAAFGGERMTALMASMGMPPDEKLSHPLVDRALVNAQKKLDRRYPNATVTESDAEWFALNTTPR